MYSARNIPDATATMTEVAAATPDTIRRGDLVALRATSCQHWHGHPQTGEPVRCQQPTALVLRSTVRPSLILLAACAPHAVEWSRQWQHFVDRGQGVWLEVQP